MENLIIIKYLWFSFDFEIYPVFWFASFCHLTIFIFILNVLFFLFNQWEKFKDSLTKEIIHLLYILFYSNIHTILRVNRLQIIILVCWIIVLKGSQSLESPLIWISVGFDFRRVISSRFILRKLATLSLPLKFRLIFFLNIFHIWNFPVSLR